MKTSKGVKNMTEIYFTIRAELEVANEVKSEEIGFMLEFSSEGTCVDGLSFNPTQGWVNYTAWGVGWSEQDKDLNLLLKAIKDFSCSMQLEQCIADVTKKDIGTEIKQNYVCDSVDADGVKFKVKIEAIDE